MSRLLGMGDMKGMINMIKEAVPMDKQPEMAKRLQEVLLCFSFPL